MGLADSRRLFFKVRSKSRIIVKKHAFIDYPERGFTKQEILNLVKQGKGNFRENDSSEAIDGSFLFFPVDDEERECKLVVLIEEVEIEGNGGPQKETIIVCSAYREVKNETENS